MQYILTYLYILEYPEIKKGAHMKTSKLLISLPTPLKAKLDIVKTKGYTASGLIRHLLEQHFKGMGHHHGTVRQENCMSGEGKT
jgi:hypothetical protein